MRIAMEDLKLERLEVIHAGKNAFPLSERIEAVPLERIATALWPLQGKKAGT